VEKAPWHNLSTNSAGKKVRIKTVALLMMILRLIIGRWCFLRIVCASERNRFQICRRISKGGTRSPLARRSRTKAASALIQNALQRITNQSVTATSRIGKNGAFGD
jgi:hypothetical protein